jgi:hypothetical protein
MTKRILTFTALAVVMFLAACKKTGPMGDAGATGANGVAGPKLKGNVVGFVTLFDEFGTRLADNAGFKITVASSNPEKSATTDADGKYLLTDVETGTYNLDFTKVGFGLFKRMSVVHIGGTAPTSLGNNNLWQTAQTIVTNLTAVAGVGDTVIISAKATPVQPTGSSTSLQRRVRFFFGRTNTVTYLTYAATFNQILIPSGGDGSFTLKLRRSNFQVFNAGETCHIIGYGLSPLENFYTDVNTNVGIYSGVNVAGVSNVANFVMP